MAKLNLVRNAMKSNQSIHAVDFTNRGFPFLLSRRFSSEPEKPQEPSPGPFRQQSPNYGTIYGKLWGVNRHTLKTDVINYLEGDNLTLDDIKVDYNLNFKPMAMVVQFPSPGSFDHGFKSLIKKGNGCKLERVPSSQWDRVIPYNGKAVLLQGIPRNALAEDVDRFLSGFDVSSVEFFTRQAFPDPLRMAVVRFPSQAQAMNVFITKNRNFCLNNQILVRVLQ